jgi:hypothetical protein
MGEDEREFERVFLSGKVRDKYKAVGCSFLAGRVPHELRRKATGAMAARQ